MLDVDRCSGRHAERTLAYIRKESQNGGSGANGAFV